VEQPPDGPDPTPTGRRPAEPTACAGGDASRTAHSRAGPWLSRSLGRSASTSGRARSTWGTCYLPQDRAPTIPARDRVSRAGTNSVSAARARARRSGPLTGDLFRTEEHGPGPGPGAGLTDRRQAVTHHTFVRSFPRATLAAAAAKSRRRREDGATEYHARHRALLRSAQTSRPVASIPRRLPRATAHSPGLVTPGTSGGWRLCEQRGDIVSSGQVSARTDTPDIIKPARGTRGGEFYSVLLGAGRSLPIANPSSSLSPSCTRMCGRFQTGVYSGTQSPPVESLPRRRRRRLRHRRASPHQRDEQVLRVEQLRGHVGGSKWSVTDPRG
jgi:hypothetical protein